jgi:hypothetical protein
VPMQPTAQTKLRVIFLPKLVLASALLLACARSVPGSGVDAHGEDAAPLQLKAAACGGSECSRDEDCKGVGAKCEPNAHVCTERCPGLVVRTAADLDAAQRCNEIDGDLRLVVTEPLTIGPRDLPYLTRISGSLFSIGGQPVPEITLSALREVGTEDAQTLIEISLDESLRRVSMPKLSVVHGALSLFGLYALEELDLPAVTSVDQLSLINLPKLVALSLPADLPAGALLDFEYLCDLPAEAIEPDGTVRKAIGCCTESAVQCDYMICNCD